jgi:hypothetical protein
VQRFAHRFFSCAVLAATQREPGRPGIF